VPEKADGFPFGIPPDHYELPSLVARHRGFSRATRKALVFFRPITQRIEIVDASFRLFRGNSKLKWQIAGVFIARGATKLIVRNAALTTYTRSVMGLKKRSLSRSGAANHTQIATKDQELAACG
jgi:hypothetical protein